MPAPLVLNVVFFNTGFGHSGAKIRFLKRSCASFAARCESEPEVLVICRSSVPSCMSSLRRLGEGVSVWGLGLMARISAALNINETPVTPKYRHRVINPLCPLLKARARMEKVIQ